MIYWVNEPNLHTEESAAASGLSDLEHPRYSWTHRARRPSPRVLLIGILGAWVLFEAVRLAYAAMHPRPNIPLNEQLVIESAMPWETARFSLANGYRLTEVNGRPISNAEELGHAAVPDGAGRIGLRFAAPDGGQDGIDVIWMELSSYPEFRIGQDATLLAAPGLEEQDAGSTIRSVNNRPVRTQEEAEALTKGGWRNPSVLLERANGASFILAYTIIDWPAHFMILLSGIAISICASIVLVLRGGFTGARAFFWFSVNLALFALARSIPFYYRSELEQWVYLLAQLLLPATSIIFLFNLSPLRIFATRPVTSWSAILIFVLSVLPALLAARAVMASGLPELRGEAWPVFVWLLAAPAGLAHAIDAAAKFAFRKRLPGYMSYGFGIPLALGIGAWWFVPPELALGILPYGIFRAWEFWMLAIVLAGLGSELPLKFRRIPISPLDKQRAGLLRLACFCSFLPMVGYTFVEYSVLSDTVRPRFLIELAQIAFPALLAVGVVRQNVLNLPRLARESITAVVVVAAGIIGYGVVWTIAMPLIPDNSETAFALYSAVYTGLLIVFLAALQFLLARYANRGRIFGNAGEEEFMVRLHEMTSKAGSVNEVYDFMTREFADTLGVSTLHLALNAHELCGDTTTSGSPGDATEVWTAELKAAAELFRHMGAQVSVVFVSDLEERTSHASAEIFDALHQLGVTAGLPLRDNNQIVGALLLGKKDNNRNFSVGETMFLSRVARRLGVSLKAISNRGMRHSVRIADSFPGHPAEIAGFSIVRTLGQGGTSFVYLGSKNRHFAAIKVANHSVQANPILRSRFEREAELLEGMQHANIVRMIEHGSVGTEPYIALEYLEDGSLRERLERSGPLGELDVARVVNQAAAALEAAYVKHVIHRDIKPGNLYLSHSGHLKIADFGIGRYEDDDLFTLTGERLGTLAYMAPEALIGDAQTWKSDQYALGISAFELLVGHRPFEERSLGAQIAAKKSNPLSLAKTLSSHASRGLCAVILTMISPKPADRYDEYDELRSHLLDVFGRAIELPNTTGVHSESEPGVSD